ncbi:hypothetical protein NNJEOMEG_03627 [Fundidesulfovibrio magnetotacticus]|uniref:Uncharacterized protein n=1 Tax=Fundidesulfovibrio magnetotacticus TaxID=2730080 RepID=A0A6V8M0I3_9BACT|nr:hypothetical protein [Fundidesulfovibrio magnetotacticus]GFK95759.1 hypothetical protein NNJEOMEG_03627 [Fundidesulfovibrio magnetotacticus]
MNKTIWVTILEQDEAKGRALFEAIHRYGLGVNGHFWVDDLEKMQWAGAFSEISKPETAVWLIRGQLASFQDETKRYGLSMLAAMVQAMKGHGFPVMVLCDGGELDPATLPTPLKGVAPVKDDASLMAKLVAKANTPVPKVEPEYHLDIHPLPGLGQWFEVGPAKGHAWAGAIFGVQGGADAAEVDAHGVGPRGTVPEKAVLEYPMKGVKFSLGEAQFDAWAVKNALDDATSYYVRVKGNPRAVAFGSFPEGDEAEMFVVGLK